MHEHGAKCAGMWHAEKPPRSPCPVHTFWHIASSKLKGIFGWRKGFQICPHQFPHLLHHSSPGILSSCLPNAGLTAPDRTAPDLQKCTCTGIGYTIPAFLNAFAGGLRPPPPPRPPVPAHAQAPPSPFRRHQVPEHDGDTGHRAYTRRCLRVAMKRCLAGTATSAMALNHLQKPHPCPHGQSPQAPGGTVIK